MKSFQEFWPFYLQEHSDPTNRRLHFAGTLCVHIILIYALASQEWAAPVGDACGGLCACMGWSFVVEKNRPHDVHASAVVLDRGF